MAVTPTHRGTAGSGGILSGITKFWQILLVIAIFVWAFRHNGGVSFHTIPGKRPGDKDPQKIFTWHPLFMTLAFPVMMGEALLVWRQGTWFGSRWSRKLWHAAYHTIAVVFFYIAIAAVVVEKNVAVPARDHLQTVHSWLGVAIVLLATLQWLVGLASFLILRNSNFQGKAALLEYHKFFGFVTFLAGTAECALGATELTAFTKDKGVINVMGILGLLLLAVGTFVMLTLHGPHSAPLPPGDDALGGAHHQQGIEATGYGKGYGKGGSSSAAV